MEFIRKCKFSRMKILALAKGIHERVARGKINTGTRVFRILSLLDYKLNVGFLGSDTGKILQSELLLREKSENPFFLSSTTGGSENFIRRKGITLGQYKMENFSFFMFLLAVGNTLGYMPHSKEQYLTDLLLRDMVERMGKDLAAAADNYLDISDTNRDQLSPNILLSNRVIKDLENEEISDPVHFERLAENPNPSLRDQEYLQHSSLWGHQFVAGGAGEGKQHLKPDGSVQNQQQIKTDGTLPAYCNPPNPCPLGYSGEDGCLEEFENTAAFSRDYQASQDCMCDSEHMFECPARGFDTHEPDLDNELDLDRIMEKLTVEDEHKNLVAKKFHIQKDSNPFLRGEKLPVAAKKGNKLLKN